MRGIPRPTFNEPPGISRWYVASLETSRAASSAEKQTSERTASRSTISRTGAAAPPY